jgi:hypothetical protein
VITATLADDYLRHPSECVPHIWQYAMANEGIFANTGRWACARLAGSNARFATGTGGTPPGPLAQKTRKFGAVISDIGEGEGDPTSTPKVYGQLLDELEACGSKVDKANYVVNPPPDPSTMTSTLARMRQNGVTTVMCMAVFGNCILAQKAADNIGYFPEWVSTTFSQTDTNLLNKGLPATQRGRMMGLSFVPKQVLPQLDPWYQALRSADPSLTIGTDSATVGFMRIKYWTLLLMASGIQMAGPRLTPETFADGLWRTKFPNPSTPLYEGAVGFAPRSLQMTTDAAEFFISNTETGPYTDTAGGTGVVCYVDHGRRHTVWTKAPDTKFFTRDCDSGG